MKYLKLITISLLLNILLLNNNVIAQDEAIKVRTINFESSENNSEEEVQTLKHYIWTEFKEIVNHSDKIKIVAGWDVIVPFVEIMNEGQMPIFIPPKKLAIESPNAIIDGKFFFKGNGLVDISLSIQPKNNGGIVISSKRAEMRIPKREEEYSKEIEYKFRTLIYDLLAPIDKSLEKKKKDIFKHVFFNSSDSNLKILILPLRPDRDNPNLQNDYSFQLLKRLRIKQENENLNVTVQLSKDFEHPVTHTDAKEMGRSINADMILWGSYTEQDSIKSGLESVNICYSLTNPFSIDKSKLIGDTGPQDIKELKQLQNGYLQNDIDYIIHWIEGMAAYEKNDFKLALTHFQKVPIIENDEYSLESLTRLGEIFYDLGKYNDALTYQRKSISIQEKMPDFEKLKLAESYNNLGFTMGALGIYDTAYIYHKRSMNIHEEELDSTDIALANSYQNLAYSLVYLSKYKDALVYNYKDVEIKENLLDSLNLDLAESYNQLGYTFYLLKDHVKALNYQKKALIIREKKLDPNHPRLADSYNNVGIMLNSFSKHDTALLYLRKSHSIYLEILDSFHPYIATSFDNIGRTYFHKKDYEEAIKNYHNALNIRKLNFDSIHPLIAYSFNNLGLGYKKLKDYPNALKYYHQALEIRKTTLDSFHNNLANSYNNIGYVYQELGDENQFIFYYKKAIKIWAENLGEKNPLVANCYYILAHSYLKLEDYRNAVELIEKAWSINKELPNQDENFYSISGVAYAKNNQLNKAWDAFQKYEKKFPSTIKSEINKVIYYGVVKDFTNCFVHLNGAIQLGFSDIEWLETDSSLTKIRKKKRYKLLVKKVKDKYLEIVN